jgi:WD40 repeat protein
MWEAPPPSPGSEGPPARLGGLAAACSDGTVRLFLVHHAEDPGELWEREADLSLVPGGGTEGHCTTISWYRGPGHRYLAAGFTSGLVCLWDLAASSDLLVQDGQVRPVQSWLGHFSSITCIALCPSQTEFPQYAVSGGTDRCYKFWDLRDTTVPLQEVKRSLVTSLSWLPGLPAVSVSCDNVYLMSHTPTVVTESQSLNGRNQPVVLHNSAVWSQATSPWLGGLALGSAAGELILYVHPPNSSRAAEEHKGFARYRCYVYRTERSSLVFDPAAALDVNSDDYAGLKERSTLRYIDIWGASGAAAQAELERLKTADRMPPDELAAYPLASINCVAWNPNLGAEFWLASAGQAGLVRVHSLASMETPAFRTAVKSLAKPR